MTVTLQTRNLHKTYDKEVKAVQGIDLEIKKGEVFGLLGPNGAGKTTLIKMLVGILKPDKGEILFNGIKLNGTTELKGMIGYAPQELVFYPFLTVLENMQLYASLYSIKNTRKRIDEILELFQLTELSKRQAEKIVDLSIRDGNISIPRIFIDGTFRLTRVRIGKVSCHIAWAHQSNEPGTALGPHVVGSILIP